MTFHVINNVIHDVLNDVFNFGRKQFIINTKKIIIHTVYIIEIEIMCF